MSLRRTACLLALLSPLLPLLSGCATCRSRADAWIGEPVRDAIEKFGEPDVKTSIGPNERYTWLRMIPVADAWASTGRTSNPLRGGATPRGELPSANPIEPSGDTAGYSERVAALLVSSNGTVLAWSGSCEAFAPPSGFLIW